MNLHGVKCISCGEERPGITATAYGIHVLVCNECVREGVSLSARSLGKMIKKKAPKAFKALSKLAAFSKGLRVIG